VSEDQQADVTPDTQPGAAAPGTQPGDVPGTPASPQAGQEVTLARGTRLSDLVAGRLTDQARQTRQAARARRVSNTGGEPGVLDVTPLRELASELAGELRTMRARERIARALRQAADMIDPPR